MTGEILKNELLNRGLVLSDIAKRLGMSPQHLNQALNAADIKSGLIERICDVLGLSIAEMYHVPPVRQYNIKEDEKKNIVLQVWYWEGLYASDKVPLSQKTTELFPFTEDGISQAVAWLNQALVNFQ